MTGPVTEPAGLELADRPRPAVHFTAEEGWINDPYGVRWVADRYHMFYQAIPGQVVWGPNCHWGHAESFDLVHWEAKEMALTPQEFEVGCWSGSFVVDDMGTHRLFYTRVTGEDWGKAAIAVATRRPSSIAWSARRQDVLVAGPPPGTGVFVFRDPTVFKHQGTWVMLVGCGFDDGSAGVMQYESADLDHWAYKGIVARRFGNEVDGAWTGALWECPQLVQVDDRWVLLVSVWDDDVLHYVAAAVGAYDGQRFSASSWQQLTYGNSAYAMSAFRDLEGRPCVISWLREEPQNNPSLRLRAGAHSVVSCLSVREGRVVLYPHPNLVAAPGAERPLKAGHRTGGIGVGAHAVLLELPRAKGAEVVVGEPGHPRLVAHASTSGSAVTLERPGFGPPVEVPLAAPEGTVSLLVDGDIVEAFTACGYGACRISASRAPSATEASVAGLPASVEARATVLPG